MDLKDVKPGYYWARAKPALGQPSVEDWRVVLVLQFGLVREFYAIATYPTSWYEFDRGVERPGELPA